MFFVVVTAVVTAAVVLDVTSFETEYQLYNGDQVP